MRGETNPAADDSEADRLLSAAELGASLVPALQTSLGRVPSLQGLDDTGIFGGDHFLRRSSSTREFVRSRLERNLLAQVSLPGALHASLPPTPLLRTRPGGSSGGSGERAEDVARDVRQEIVATSLGVMLDGMPSGQTLTHSDTDFLGLYAENKLAHHFLGEKLQLVLIVHTEI